ncbi:DivIVA domain-containing protein [Geodermatophilus sp. URMC 64]
MTTNERGSGERGRRLSPNDLHSVQFSRGTMLRPGYNEEEVDRFLNRVAQEVSQLHAEKADLRSQVRALQDQVEEAVTHEAPSDQAVKLLATAQQTADQYVSEAEDFSRQMTADARARYEESLRTARESAGAIIQAAHEQAARMVGTGTPAAEEPAAPQRSATTEELEEQVAYLKAFAQACRTQLRAYLEALLTDVESEWGRAEPSALPQAPLRTPAQRGAPATERAAAAQGNVAREMPMSDSTSEHPIVTAEVVEQRG